MPRTTCDPHGMIDFARFEHRLATRRGCHGWHCSRRPVGGAHASHSEAATGRHYTIAPPQLEPAPAVQPKQ